jgi:hypothetical protein
MSPLIITDDPEIAGQMTDDAVPNPEIATERVSKNQNRLILRSL